ncbi:hypothetical protein [Fulvimarina sp. MAC8]|uniref:hypothetical protein n=1 Tax=Fulvimarina sp. MAC8 TaxID=3162874 RepID=UPI0032EDE590
MTPKGLSIVKVLRRRDSKAHLVSLVFALAFVAMPQSRPAMAQTNAFDGVWAFTDRTIPANAPIRLRIVPGEDLESSKAGLEIRRYARFCNDQLQKTQKPGSIVQAACATAPLLRLLQRVAPGKEFASFPFRDLTLSRGYVSGTLVAGDSTLQVDMGNVVRGEAKLQVEVAEGPEKGARLFGTARRLTPSENAAEIALGPNLKSAEEVNVPDGTYVHADASLRAVLVVAGGKATLKVGHAVPEDGGGSKQCPSDASEYWRNLCVLTYKDAVVWIGHAPIVFDPTLHETRVAFVETAAPSAYFQSLDARLLMDGPLPVLALPIKGKSQPLPGAERALFHFYPTDGSDPLEGQRTLSDTVQLKEEQPGTGPVRVTGPGEKPKGGPENAEETRADPFRLALRFQVGSPSDAMRDRDNFVADVINEKVILTGDPTAPHVSPQVGFQPRFEGQELVVTFTDSLAKPGKTHTVRYYLPDEAQKLSGRDKVETGVLGTVHFDDLEMEDATIKRAARATLTYGGVGADEPANANGATGLPGTAIPTEFTGTWRFHTLKGANFRFSVPSTTGGTGVVDLGAIEGVGCDMPDYFCVWMRARPANFRNIEAEGVSVESGKVRVAFDEVIVGEAPDRDDGDSSVVELERRGDEFMGRVVDGERGYEMLGWLPVSRENDESLPLRDGSDPAAQTETGENTGGDLFGFDEGSSGGSGNGNQTAQNGGGSGASGNTLSTTQGGGSSAGGNGGQAGNGGTGDGEAAPTVAFEFDRPDYDLIDFPADARIDLAVRQIVLPGLQGQDSCGESLRGALCNLALGEPDDGTPFALDLEDVAEAEGGLPRYGLVQAAGNRYTTVLYRTGDGLLLDIFGPDGTKSSSRLGQRKKESGVPLDGRVMVRRMDDGRPIGVLNLSETGLSLVLEEGVCEAGGSCPAASHTLSLRDQAPEEDRIISVFQAPGFPSLLRLELDLESKIGTFTPDRRGATHALTLAGEG